MPRVIGIDLGTVSIDLCGLDDGRVLLEQSVATADALAHPAPLVRLLDAAHRSPPFDLVAGPSVYGLPLTPSHATSPRSIRVWRALRPRA